MMKFPLGILPLYGMLLLSLGSYGEDQILSKYKGAIQNYIMTGYESTWRHCDMLSANSYFYEGVPQVTMDLDKIETLNAKSAFSSSACLLVIYDVSSKFDLSTLLEFGQNAINYVRLALVIKMRSGITLEMATNTSNLPYLVAAESQHGMEQFICPVVAEVKPRLRHEMCSPSYLDYKNKVLRIGLMGIPPDFVLTSTGSIEGVNIQLIKMMAERLKFTPEINIAASFIAAEDQVCKPNLQLS